MADTLLNIDLPSGEWVDLYDVSGVVVGTRIQLQNIGASDVYLTTQATEPTDKDKYRILPSRYMSLNTAGDSGAWALSPHQVGKVNLSEYVVTAATTAEEEPVASADEDTTPVDDTLPVDDTTPVDDAAPVDDTSGTILVITGITGVNTITGVGTPPITSYAENVLYSFTTVGANDDVVTADFGAGAKSVYKDTDQELEPGDFGDTQDILLSYVLATDNFHWDNPPQGAGG